MYIYIYIYIYSIYIYIYILGAGGSVGYNIIFYFFSTEVNQALSKRHHPTCVPFGVFFPAPVHCHQPGNMQLRRWPIATAATKQFECD